MAANEQGLLSVIEFENIKLEQMQNIITKVEGLRDKFRSHYALEENAYQRACDDVIELLQLLQQTPCTTHVPCTHTYKTTYIGVGYVAQCTKCGLVRQ